MNLRSLTIYTIPCILIIIGVAVYLVIFQNSLLTIESDLSYHLATAQSFVREGGLTLQETWDSLPEGRPHLYPPAFHFLMAVLVYMKFAPYTVIQVVWMINLISMLALSSYAIAKIFNWRVSFFYLLCITANVSFLRVSGATIPATMVLFLSPFILILIKKRALYASGLFLAVLLYTHMIFPWVVIAALIVWALFNRNYLKITLRAILVSVALYFPWLLHVASNLEYLRYFSPGYRKIIETSVTYSFSVSFFILFLVCLLIVLRRWKYHLYNKDLIYFVGLVCVSLPIAYFEFPRFAYSIGFFAMAPVVAYVLSESFLRFNENITIKNIFKLSFVLFSLVCIVFTVSISFKKGEYSSISFQKHLFLEAIPSESRFYLGRHYSHHFNENNISLAQKIAESTPADAVILGYSYKLDSEVYAEHRTYVLTQLLASLSNRRMGDLRSPELNWQKRLEASQADIVLINDQRPGVPNYIRTRNGDKIILGESFEELARFDDSQLIVLKNKNVQKVPLPTSFVVIPLWLGWGILLLIVCFIGYLVCARLESNQRPSA